MGPRRGGGNGPGGVEVEWRPMSRWGHQAGRDGLGIVDYTLAKRAQLRDFRSGLLSRPDICDAHPELLRAARYLGAEASHPCPVCRRYELRLLAYVFADGLKGNNGRAFEVEKGLAVAARHRGGACYVVEVCTWCSWNHLSEAFRARHAG